MRMKLIAVAALFVLVAVLSVPLAAQTVTGTISGHVADKTGAVIPGAKIKAVNTNTGAVREVATNQEGYYLFSFMPLGTYNVTTSMTGFRSVQKTGVLVELNNNTVSDFALDIATTTTEVEVKGGEIPLIDTTSGEIKSGLDEQQIVNTPLTGRNFMSLVEQVPGFQPAAFNSSSNNPTNSTGSYAAFSGQGSRSTTFQIDGVNNDDSSENQNRQNVNVSAIKEFKVLTNSYSAEFGRAGGAVVLVQTKGGTNAFHGDVYDFIQNDLFNANDFFSNMAGTLDANGKYIKPKRPPVRRNQYGGTIGGPIVKDKVFFFGSVERVSNVGKGSMSRFVWLPTDAPHACAPGEVSRPGGPYCVDPATHPNLQRDLDWMKSVMALWDTPELKGVAPNDEAACSLIIASGRPNRCVRVAGLGYKYPDSDYSGRLDWNTSNSTNMNIRYQYSRQIRQSPRIILGDNYGTGNNRQYNIAYTATHVFSPSQTGEFRYGFGNRNTNQEVTDSNEIPILRFGTTQVQPALSSDTLAFAGTVIGTSTNVPILRKQRDHQLVYNHMLVLGRHTLRAGIDQRFQALDDVASGTQRGYWTFSTPYTTAQQNALITSATAGFTTWEMFLMGIGGAYQKGFGDPYAQNRFNETNLYLEDSFRVTNNLTLNVGARWEGVSAPHEINDKFSYGYGGDYDNIEPRIGFAWTPGFLNRTSGDLVIRGGFGMYHTRVFQSIFSQSGLSYRYQPPNGFLVGAYPSVCPGNAGANITAPAGTFFIDGARFEISDQTCGYQYAPGKESYSLASDAGGVRVKAGMLQTTLLLPDPKFHLPYSSQWNLTIEKQLPFKMALQIGYNGNRGVGLPFFSGINDAQWGITSPLVTVDVGGGNYQPVVYDRLCKDFSDPICLNTGNPATFSPTASGARRTFSGYGTTASLANKGIVIENGVPHGYISASSPQTTYRRPDPTHLRNVRLSNFAFTYYNAMVVKLTKATSQGLTFNAFWTWSKTMDTGSESTYTGTDVNAPSGATNPQKSLRGLSAFSQKHRFVVSANYETPWMKNQAGWLGRIVGGWNLGGVMTFASGLPFTILAGYDLNLDGVGGDRPVMADPTVVGRSLDNGHSQNPCPTTLSATGRCVNTLSELRVPASAFHPNYTTLSGDDYPLFPGVAFPEGAAPRNAFFQQGQKNVDAALTKRIRIAERFNLNMRFEMYNLFNRVTFAIPAYTTVTSGGTATNPQLGRISSTINLQNYVNSARTTGARMGQLSLRLTF